MKHQRLVLAAKALTGTSIGDAFGESFFGNRDEMLKAIQERCIPQTTWNFTDDTIMAVSLYRSLKQFENINQDYVAALFLENYRKDPERGYGPSMHHFFRSMEEGHYWKNIAAAKFEGMGSMGNGGAMRVVPLGAWFFDDLEMAKQQAILSCEITHSNVEAKCGAIAVAVAAALATRMQLGLNLYDRDAFLEEIIRMLPECDTRSKIEKAYTMKDNYSMATMVYVLGNGEKMLAQDTVPLALWCAAKHLDSVEDCLWELIAALGDRDTLCAIAGGIVFSSGKKNVSWEGGIENWQSSVFCS